MNCIRKKGRKKRKNRLSASCDFGGRTPPLSPSPLYKDRLDKREGKARYCHSVSRRSSWDQYPFRTFSCDSQRDSSPCETGENSFLSFARSPFFPRVVFLSFSSLSLDEASRTTISSKDPRARAPTTEIPGQISRANPSSAPSPKRVVKPRCGNSMLASTSHRDCSSFPLFIPR